MNELPVFNLLTEDQWHYLSEHADMLDTMDIRTIARLSDTDEWLRLFGIMPVLEVVKRYHKCVDLNYAMNE